MLNLFAVIWEFERAHARSVTASDAPAVSALLATFPAAQGAAATVLPAATLEYVCWLFFVCSDACRNIVRTMHVSFGPVCAGTAERSFSLRSLSHCRCRVLCVFVCVLRFVSACRAVLGGILSQEVIKAVTGKDAPIQNWLFVDAVAGTGPAYRIRRPRRRPPHSRWSLMRMIRSDSHANSVLFLLLLHETTLCWGKGPCL